MDADYLEQVFGDGGLFAARLPGYEMRPGQLALARTVDRAIREGRHALAEGPCGTGKSLAYSVPAVHHATQNNKSVVIATANIALQEQLVRKDLPLLADVLPWTFSFTLLKGRNNYVCIDRRTEAEVKGPPYDLFGDGQATQMDEVLAWAGRTQTGDVSELPFVPAPAVWSKVSVGSDECKGDACRLSGSCYYERAKEEAWDSADIIVTNYHLLFAHLALRREIGRDVVLPPFDVLICDEAHEAADIARDFFGFTISEHTIRRLATYAEQLGDEHLAERLRSEGENFFYLVGCYARSPVYGCRLRRPGFVAEGPLIAELQRLAARASACTEDEDLDRADRALAERIARRAERTALRLVDVVLQLDSNQVYWIELDGKGRPRLKAKPIDVAPLLRTEVFDRTATVVMASATLTTGGRFDFIRREVGAPESLEVVAETPFDFEKQALLIVPEDLPDPRDAAFAPAVATAMRQVMDLCGGRTLGLFTSYRNLNAVYDRVAGNGHRVLRQGDLPRGELTRIFKEDVSSVLLGTDSFWTGIDVPGEALTAVVIDKLPFPHPEDPLVDAICERDRLAFRNYLLPKAIIALRQGVGRLIRTQSDDGVVVLLDRRLVEKPYGREFLRSLPPMLTSRRIENIPRFLSEAKDACTG